MGNISITKQYDELEYYTQIKEYINKVLNNFNDLNNIDRNDIYELVYAKKMCSNKLNQGIENTDIRKAFEDALDRIELILNLLNEDTINKALKHPLNKNKVDKVNSVKLSKSNKLPNLLDKSKPKFHNSTEEYFKRIATKCLLIVCLVIIMFSVDDITKLLSGMTVETSISDVILTEQVTPDMQVTNTVDSLYNIVSILIHVTALALFMATSISIVIDTMYVSLPMFRHMVDSRGNKIDTNRIVSNEAIEAVQLEGTVTGYHYIDNYDKVDAASVLLDSMISSLKDTNNKEPDTEIHTRNLLTIKNKINNCKKKYDEIVCLADAEVYYTSNKKYFDNIMTINQ